LKYLNKYQDTNNPNILTILISKKKPSLTLKKPISTQLFSVAPNPNDFDSKKKFLTTPSGKKNDMKRLTIVPTTIPNIIVANIKDIFFFILNNYQS
jgi:hypothetical protein